MGKIIAVCSGCGGVGKSTVALAAAIGASSRGLRTILLDASGSARACDLMLGIDSLIVLDMLDVIKLQTTIESALYAVPGRKNLSFACASLYDGEVACAFSGILLALRAMCDILIIDMPTGPLMMAQDLFDANDRLLLLTRPDDISLRACERLLGRMTCAEIEKHLIIVRADDKRIKKKRQYTRQQVEMLLDMPATACIAEEESIQLRCEKGKTSFENDLRLRSELNKLLDAIL